jgi:hypothetical protein
MEMIRDLGPIVTSISSKRIIIKKKIKKGRIKQVSEKNNIIIIIYN